MTDRLAHCQCGALRLRLEGEPARVSICCCTQCQRRPGSAFGVGAYFSADQVKDVEGPEYGLHAHFRRRTLGPDALLRQMPDHALLGFRNAPGIDRRGVRRDRRQRGLGSGRRRLDGAQGAVGHAAAGAPCVRATNPGVGNRLTAVPKQARTLASRATAGALKSAQFVETERESRSNQRTRTSIGHSGRIG